MTKLSELDADKVAEEVNEWVQDQIGRLSFAIGVTDPAITGTVSGLSFAARIVVHYAQTGEEPGDAPIAEYLQTITEALYTAAHPEVYPTVATDYQERSKDPEYGIDCAIRSAVCRDAVSQKQAVPIAWLAALASLPIQTLRTYQARGNIKVDDGEVKAAEAIRWLEARGVPGIGRRTSNGD